MRRLPLWTAVLLIAAAWAQRDLHKIGQVRFDETSPVWALGFSDDQTRLAVGLGEYQTGQFPEGLVIVISVANPKQTLGRSNYGPLYLSKPAWSGESRYSIRATAPAASAVNLGEAGWWHVERNSQDSSMQKNSHASCAVDGQLTGTLVCTPSPAGVPVTLKGIVVNGPFSLGGTRVAISQLTPHNRPRWMRDVLDTNGFSLDYKRRLIWDFGVNRIIASWTPWTQPTRSGPLRAAFALSPDGKLFAEGESGEVRIYQVK
jgi:hypothetical protein